MMTILAGRYFSPGTLIYTVNKNDNPDIWNIDERSHKHPDNLNTNRGKLLFYPFEWNELG